MKQATAQVITRDVQRLFQVGCVAGLSDAQLLERFARESDGASFEALVAVRWFSRSVAESSAIVMPPTTRFRPLSSFWLGRRRRCRSEIRWAVSSMASRASCSWLASRRPADRLDQTDRNAGTSRGAGMSTGSGTARVMVDPPRRDRSAPRALPGSALGLLLRGPIIRGRRADLRVPGRHDQRKAVPGARPVARPSGGEVWA